LAGVDDSTAAKVLQISDVASAIVAGAMAKDPGRAKDFGRVTPSPRGPVFGSVPSDAIIL